MNLPQWLTSIASLCARKGFGTPGTNLFVNSMPTTPTVCTAIYPSGGMSVVGDPVRRPTVRILHRRPLDQQGAGLTYIASLDTLFRDQWNRLDASNLGRFVPLQEIGQFVYDGNNAVVYTMTYQWITVG